MIDIYLHAYPSFSLSQLRAAEGGTRSLRLRSHLCLCGLSVLTPLRIAWIESVADQPFDLAAVRGLQRLKQRLKRRLKLGGGHWDIATIDYHWEGWYGTSTELFPAEKRSCLTVLTNLGTGLSWRWKGFSNVWITIFTFFFHTCYRFMSSILSIVANYY